MDAALYGPSGFYRSPGAPGRHFRTAAHAGAGWAEALARLVSEVDDELGRPEDFTVVDMGAGGGELLAGLAALGPSRWRLLGIDVAPRPPDLAARVGWQGRLPSSFAGVLIAVEWLDVVPVDVAERHDDGARLVEVNDAGEERLGPVVGVDDRDWLDSWWPLAEVGDRAEIGRPRDDAWMDALNRLGRGLAVAIDYAAVPSRDVAGTLTGYKEGRQVMPVPDGSTDITAHVLFESLASGAAVTETRRLVQRDALRTLGLSGVRPPYDGDPASYLQSLSRVGDETELLDLGGLGGFTWLLHAKGMEIPSHFDR
jgi:SAM-dependent MidA family methyltransferase